MRIASVLMASLLVLVALPAQAQDMQGPSWEMGWVTDVDPKFIVDLEEDWDVTGELVVYVSNDGPAELSLSLNYDYDEDGPFILDGPDSISVSGNTNDTFTISISGATAEEVRAFSPSSKMNLKIVGEEKVGESTLRTQEIDADLAVPRMFRLIPNLIPPTDDLFAGSWVEMTLEISNMGNTQDAVVQAKATIRSCPHLSVSGLEQLDDLVVQVTPSSGEGKASVVLRLEASTSHQERTCEVSIAVESEGDNTQRSSTIDADVKAPQAAEETTEEEDQETSSSNNVGDMPWVGAHEVLLAVLIGALLIRRPE